MAVTLNIAANLFFHFGAKYLEYLQDYSSTTLAKILNYFGDYASPCFQTY